MNVVNCVLASLLVWGAVSCGGSADSSQSASTVENEMATDAADVNANIVTGDFVDMGLPSGIHWAACNLGANKPEEVGNYYMWGETTPYVPNAKCELMGKTVKQLYDMQAINDSLDLECHRDATHGIEGVATPSLKCWFELIENTTIELITYNGVNGAKLTSKINGNAIFFPYSGYMKGEEKVDANYAFLWTSVPNYEGEVEDPNISWAYELGDVNEYKVTMGGSDRNHGMTIRPICQYKK